MSEAKVPDSDVKPTDDVRPEYNFRQAVAGDLHAQALWQTVEGGGWQWAREGALVKRTEAEWSALAYQGWQVAQAAGSPNFVIEVAISGKAEAAGLSFGPYKDFLAPLEPAGRRRHLQLEVDGDMGCWAFRVDGQLMQRSWWDAAVGSVADLSTGVLTLKTKRAEEVLFQDLKIHTFSAPCQLSVVMTCYRFLQRMRIALRNWCYQELPSGTHEILVVNPQSPDGTHEHLAAVARSFPHVRVREITVDSQLANNKGAMINRALEATRGEWIWLTDADCLFAPQGAAAVLAHIRGRHDRLFYGQQRYLTPAQTDALLAGRLDPLHDFTELTREANTREPENSPWGYTQIIHRSTLRRVRYPEEMDHFAHSDGVFTEACRRTVLCLKRWKACFVSIWTTRFHGTARAFSCEQGSLSQRDDRCRISVWFCVEGSRQSCTQTWRRSASRLIGSAEIFRTGRIGWGTWLGNLM